MRAVTNQQAPCPASTLMAFERNHFYQALAHVGLSVEAVFRN